MTPLRIGKSIVLTINLVVFLFQYVKVVLGIPYMICHIIQEALYFNVVRGTQIPGLHDLMYVKFQYLSIYPHPP